MIHLLSRKQVFFHYIFRPEIVFAASQLSPITFFELNYIAADIYELRARYSKENRKKDNGGK